MLKVSVLGYWGTFPSAGGATSGYLISTGEGNILLDCGSGIMSKLPFYTNFESISGVILSHLHSDHICDIGILQYAFNWAMRNGSSNKLKIYAPSKPKNIWESIYDNHYDMYPLETTNLIQLAGAQIEFMPVKHTIPCYATKICYDGKTIVYITDTVFFEQLIDFAKDADLLICESAICKGSNHTTGKGHMDAKHAGYIAKNANAKRLLLSHIPHDGDMELLRKDASFEFGKDVLMPQIRSEYLI